MNNNKDAIVISLSDNVSEIIELADSLNYHVIKTFFQRREAPDVNSFIGSGKVREIKEFIEDSAKVIDLVIVDDGDSDDDGTDDGGANDGQTTDDEEPKDDSDSELDSNGETPGFELFFLLAAISIIVFLKKKKTC